MQSLAQDSNSVAAAEVDVHAGVAALQSGDLDPPRACGIGLARTTFATCLVLKSASAADTQRSFFFAIEVEKVLRLENAAWKFICAGQACFFVNGEDELQRAVLDVGALHHGQGGGDADAIVGAERGAVGFEPVAVAQMRMASVSKLKGVPSFFSQTMSRWPCNSAMCLFRVRGTQAC